MDVLSRSGFVSSYYSINVYRKKANIKFNLHRYLLAKYEVHRTHFCVNVVLEFDTGLIMVNIIKLVNDSASYIHNATLNKRNGLKEAFMSIIFVMRTVY